MMTTRIPVRRAMDGARTATLLPALLALLAGAAPASAALAFQASDVRAERECRCVDRDGNEIENCTCIRAPRIEVVAPMASTLFARRAQIGVWIDYEQGDEVDRQGGALLTEVQDDGPAAEAGLRAGDIVLSVDGHSLRDPLPDAEDEEELNLDASIPVQRFTRLVGALEPGEEAEFQVLRDGDRRTVTVTPERTTLSAFGLRGDAPAVIWDGGERLRMDLEALRGRDFELRGRLEEMAERERDLQGRVWRFQAPEAGGVWSFRTDSLEGQNRLHFFGGDPCFALRSRDGEGFAVLARGGNCVDGVELLELNPDLAEYFDASEGSVLVTEVAEESTLGLRAGDVLLAIGGREIRDPDHARRILSSYEMDEEIRLRVLRQGREIEVLGRRRDG